MYRAKENKSEALEINCKPVCKLKKASKTELSNDYTAGPAVGPGELTLLQQGQARQDSESTGPASIHGHQPGCSSTARELPGHNAAPV